MYALMIRPIAAELLVVNLVWETAVENFQVSIDGQPFPCRLRCSFMQYMPQKPAKFDSCDAENYYVLDISPYVGHEQNRTENGLAQHVVHKLVAVLQLRCQLNR